MQENILSSKLFNNAKQLIPGGVNSPVRAFRNVGGEPFFVRAAKGSKIWDVDNNEMIDYIGTWGPAILGHAPLPVIEAVHETAKKGVSFGIPNPLEIEIAKIIVDWVPSVEKVRMVNSGTEATMSAVRLSRGYTGREKIIKFEGCYHGHVDSLLVSAGSGALTHGEPDSAGVPEGFARETITLPFNDQEKVRQCFEKIGDEIAAVILEPVPANAGLFFPQDGFLEFLREITKEHGALLIFDEVMTGFRVAKGGVQEIYGITPDITALGKVIGGGLPVGAFGGRKDIMDKLAPDGPVYQAGTLSGNPLAMAAGIAQLKELEKLSAWDRLEEIGALLESGVREAIEDAGRPYTFHRIGSMFCLFFHEGPINNLESATAAANTGEFPKFFHHCLSKGIYLAPSPYETGFISMAHSEDDINQTVEVIKGALA